MSGAAAAGPFVPQLVTAAPVDSAERFVIAAHNNELARIGAPVPLKKRAAAYASAVLRITYREPLDGAWLQKRTALEELFRETRRTAKEAHHTAKNKERQGHVAQSKRNTRKGKRKREEKSPPHIRTRPRASPSPPPNPFLPPGGKEAVQTISDYEAGCDISPAALASARSLLAAVNSVGTAAAPSVLHAAGLAAAAAAAGIQVTAFVKAGGKAPAL